MTGGAMYLMIRQGQARAAFAREAAGSTETKKTDAVPATGFVQRFLDLFRP